MYFCALEALQNVAKYAGAAQATVGLSCANGGLEFTVTDNGAGFDPGATRKGSGLQGMADRLAALGGTLDIQSVGPGTGPRCGAGCRCPAGETHRPAAADQLTTMASNDKPPATY